MLRTWFQRKNAVALVAGVLILAGLLLTLRLTIVTRDEPWFISVLKIDGPSYIKGMESIAESGDFLNLEDIYHSPGYQMYLGAIDRLYPFERGLFFGLKLLNGLLFLGTIAITVYLGERHVRRNAGWIAGAILALSLDWQVYANLLQGEVLQGFCFALFAWILMREAARVRADGETARVRRKFALPAASLLAAFLTLLQVRYFPLVPLSTAALLLIPAAGGNGSAASRMRAAAWFLGPCLVILGAWSWHQSGREGRALFVSKGSEFRIRVAYNPNATGASYPYPEVVEPTGLRFVLSHPGKVAWLVRERLLYLGNWKRDIWDLGNPVTMHAKQKIVPTALEIPVHVVGTLLFVAGVWLRIRNCHAHGHGSAAIWLYVWILAVVAGPVLVFASSRFLIAALPVMALFQAHALLALARGRHLLE
ncbi:MAG: hypothetical protein HKN20_10430 [Gemmatimonadetes bacterium]|nr:hypothetical protein [Gemmatimonadota bacterium]